MKIAVSEATFSHLEFLRRQTKFTAEHSYPGAPTEEIRLACERRVNDYLQETIVALRKGIEREELFERARALNRSFAEEDTEEAERVDDYIGETMRAIGIEDWMDHV